MKKIIAIGVLFLFVAKVNAQDDSNRMSAVPANKNNTTYTTSDGKQPASEVSPTDSRFTPATSVTRNGAVANTNRKTGNVVSVAPADRMKPVSAPVNTNEPKK